jgi:hypothetical protein
LCLFSAAVAARALLLACYHAFREALGVVEELLGVVAGVAGRVGAIDTRPVVATPLAIIAGSQLSFAINRCGVSGRDGEGKGGNNLEIA